MRNISAFSLQKIVCIFQKNIFYATIIIDSGFIFSNYCTIYHLSDPFLWGTPVCYLCLSCKAKYSLTYIKITNFVNSLNNANCLFGFLPRLSSVCSLEVSCCCIFFISDSLLRNFVPFCSPFSSKME